jgi:general secretion pathway protein A
MDYNQVRKGRAFRPGPDVTAYFPAACHELALSRLLQAIRDDEGLCLLTGAPGTGKTLLCHLLLERLGDEVASVFLSNTHFAGRSGLLQAILFDLAMPYEGKSEQELRLALTDALLLQYSRGRRTLLVVDEAQNLTSDLLEELRMLVNLETGTRRAVQVVFSAQPEFLALLRQPECASAAQRLVTRVAVESLGTAEAVEYLKHQLRAADASAEGLFTPEALEVIARAGQGNPRTMNQLAHQSLALAQSVEAAIVDVEVATEALVQAGCEAPPCDEVRQFPAIAEAPDEAAADEPPAATVPMAAVDGTKPRRKRRRSPAPPPTRRPA